MGEKRGRKGWRKGEEWGLWARRACEEPKVRGDTGEMERGPRCVMVAEPPHASTSPVTLAPPHLPIHIPSSFPATFYPPQPPPPKGRGKKKEKKRDGKKENKISTVVETRGEK